MKTENFKKPVLYNKNCSANRVQRLAYLEIPLQILQITKAIHVPESLKLPRDAPATHIMWHKNSCNVPQNKLSEFRTYNRRYKIAWKLAEKQSQKTEFSSKTNRDASWIQSMQSFRITRLLEFKKEHAMSRHSSGYSNRIQLNMWDTV